VARLLSAEHNVDLIVLEGATGSTTAFGPGHLLSTAKAGERGHLAIAGHRDTHFAFLEQVRVGDVLWLEPAQGELQRFVVEDTGIVEEQQSQLLEEPGDLLTLITCYPFDAKIPGGPLRYLVKARALQLEDSLRSL
jgi:sortase A